MSKKNCNVSEEKSGFTNQQWILLAFSFLLGIVAVFTVDKVFLAGSASNGTAQAAVSQP